ncbi:MAG: Delta-9 acyl-phospholipid desaturase [Acidimicrobiales bacterium]|nr:Delta-9 acyl-phospholipid desaturase [Acidimicrobiales bacterium]
MKHHAIERGDDERINRTASIPFVLVHFLVLLSFVTGVSRAALILFLALFWGRMFFITAGYHRYFAHRSYKLGRGMQFLMAFGGSTAAQKGPLWWASHHRGHHRYSDTDLDLHSPLKGFWWSHVGWILCDKNKDWNPDDIRDFNKFPELRFLTSHDWIGPWLVGLASYAIAGWSGLVFGFFGSTVLLWHATFLVNSLAHVMGRRRYATSDTSRNSALIAFVTLGEGWHNNHHYYQASARQGFFWWEFDVSYYILKGLSLVGLVHDLKTPPARVLAAARVRDGSFDEGMFKAHWARATQALANARSSRPHRGDDLSDADPEVAGRREQLDELIRANRTALQEHAQTALAHAEELARLSRRQQRQVGVAD